MLDKLSMMWYYIGAIKRGCTETKGAGGDVKPE